MGEEKIQRLTGDSHHSFPRARASAAGKRLAYPLTDTARSYCVLLCRSVSRRIRAKVHFTEERTRIASLPPLLLPFRPPLPHPGNPGYTLAAAAPRSVLRVRGGANLQRVGGAAERGVIA